MKKNPVLIASIALTVFILAFGGILAVSANKKTDNAPAVGSAESQLTIEQYNELVRQANERILLASQGQQPATDTDASTLQTISSDAQPLISADEALDLALQAALDPESVKGSPELVRFEGKPAYEVIFEVGAIYLDALTGEILMNGTTSLVPGNVTLEQAVQIAKDYIGLDSIYQADVVSFRGSEIYRVIFNAGHFVYVDKDGQIIYVQIYSPKTSDQTAASGGDNNDDNHSDYDDDDHDDDHDDDDD